MLAHRLAGLLLEWLREDMPYRDEAAALLGLHGVCGRLRVVAKKPSVVACVEELAEALRVLGVEARAVAASGSRVEAGAVAMVLRGRGDVLSSLERLVLNVLIYASGIATRVAIPEA